MTQQPVTPLIIQRLDFWQTPCSESLWVARGLRRPKHMIHIIFITPVSEPSRPVEGDRSIRVEILHQWGQRPSLRTPCQQKTLSLHRSPIQGFSFNLSPLHRHRLWTYIQFSLFMTEVSRRVGLTWLPLLIKSLQVWHEPTSSLKRWRGFSVFIHRCSIAVRGVFMEDGGGKNRSILEVSVGPNTGRLHLSACSSQTWKLRGGCRIKQKNRLLHLTGDESKTSEDGGDVEPHEDVSYQVYREMQAAHLETATASACFWLQLNVTEDNFDCKQADIHPAVTHYSVTVQKPWLNTAAKVWASVSTVKLLF